MTTAYLADVSCLADQNLFDRLYRDAIAERKAKIDSFRFEKDKYLSLGAWSLLRYALRDVPCWESLYRTEQNGKPFLQGDPVYFSFSHSGSFALCAVSDRPVGCDIQLIKPPNYKIADDFFSPEEQKYLDSFSGESEKASAFYRIWTGKESFSKAIGFGLHYPMDRYICIPGAPVRHTVSDLQYTVSCFDMPTGYCLSICSADNTLTAPVMISLNSYGGSIWKI